MRKITCTSMISMRLSIWVRIISASDAEEEPSLNDTIHSCFGEREWEKLLKERDTELSLEINAYQVGTIL